ncbi:MAG: penicillin acylase family protein [Alphaproteobacteria bacterium]|nr:penicillin acylase family protein [Alphaproteobacteria bacterium]
MQHPSEKKLRVAGLERPATIRVDAWGIAHIAAESLEDLFLAQGFNAARDRLWQIDLWRKRGLGLLAGDFGPGYLAQDRVARRFLYRGDMDAEWSSYADDARMICTRFVEGINAWLDLIDAGAAALPPEFALMGTRPARWAPEDVVRIRTHGLAQNAASEAARAELVGRGRDQADRLRHHRHPGFDATKLPPELADPPPALFDIMKLATAPVSFGRERLAATLADAGRWSRVTELGIAPVDASDGSNSWAVHGSRTASGRPILASDPHRALTLPSLRYLVHLAAPGFDAVGAGEPCVPGISLGHNGAIAFGLTIFDADQEDIMVYETDGAERYRHRGGWERFERVEERIPVKGEADQAVTLAYSRHGAVLLEEPERKRAFALRSVWSEPGAAPYLASLTGMRARNLDEFRAALARWKAPAVNMTYAGLDGHVARLTAGYLPLRRNWNGVLPVPGDGGFEWQGNRPMADRAEDRDPPAGFVFTANECNLPADWDHARDPIGFEWSDEARSLRVREVLPGIAWHRLEDSMALQTDQVSVTARRAAAVVASLDRDGSPVRDADAARALLARWDHRLDRDSAAAALYEVWWSRHLKPGLVALATGDAREATLATPPHNQAVITLLEDAAAPLWRQAGGRAAFLGTTLAAAWRDCAARLGQDPAAWRWGDLHRMRFAHPLDPVGADPSWSVGPFPLGGGATTVMNATYRSDFAVSHGAAMRLVIDVGDWDRSRCINAPGQSGVAGDAQAGALAAAWAAGRYVPLAYSAPAVAAATRTILRLGPA